MITPYENKVRHKRLGKIYRVVAIEAELTRKYGQLVYQVIPEEIRIRDIPQNWDKVEYFRHDDLEEVK